MTSSSAASFTTGAILLWVVTIVAPAVVVSLAAPPSRPHAVRRTLQHERLSSGVLFSETEIAARGKKGSDEVNQWHVLSLFFFSTNGPSWWQNGGWASVAPTCTWYGVQCNYAGNVTSIRLKNNSLTGELTPSLAMLPYLTTFLLDDNSIEGTLPQEWGNVPDAFPSLQTLSVASNDLEGTLPDWSFGFRSLYSFRLDGNRLNGSLPAAWPTASFAATLTALILRNNALSGTIPDSWATTSGSWKYLSTVLLSGNQLQGPLPPLLFSASPYLSWLDLGRNDLSGTLPAEWGTSIPRVLQLTLSHNRLSGPLPPAWASSTLYQQAVVMDLSSNGFVGGIPWCTAKRPSLNVSSNALSGPFNFTCFGYDCPRLQTMDFAGNQFCGSYCGLPTC